MGWPTTKKDLMQGIDELLITLKDESVRPETKENNKILADAYMEDLKKYMSNGGE